MFLKVVINSAHINGFDLPSDVLLISLRSSDQAILFNLTESLCTLIGTLRSTTRQVRRRGLQNVKKQCEFKLLKEITVN